ncbi:MAG: hypothetical protein KDF60_10490 [Calditrichaeota bacterium]|nr:hypothetical protein [Calditrichota bacterium]
MFEQFSDKSQIWIYGFNKNLTENEKMIVKDALNQFKAGWLYHGQPVLGDFSILHDRFALLVTNDNISGCSIDSSVAVFKNLKTNNNLDALDQDLIFIRSSDGIVSLSRSEFRELVKNDAIPDDTIVFNLMINNLGDFRNGQFELKFADSWHSKAFKKRLKESV